MANVQKKISPGIYILIYLIGIICIVAMNMVQKPTECHASVFVDEIHNILFFFYVYLLLGIVRFKYEFIPTGTGFLFAFIILSYIFSLASFYSFLRIFIIENCTYISLRLMQESSNRLDSILIVIFIELILFTVSLLILTKK
ncbi:MAG: hypothetical protein LBF38_03845 [Deltaproteobacteria bacterium]|jgi:hypothetical protein|nr:hypothetical protein [Deltaproteobacteria bacterium]